MTIYQSLELFLKNRSIVNGLMSTDGFLPMARSANISPTTGASLNP